jgi:hypothetical protein
LAFLVDFIVRRSMGDAEVRVSLALDGRGLVERLNAATWVATGDRVVIGECTFDGEGSKGRVGDIEWDLRQELDGSRIYPQVPPIRWLRPLDMEIVSRPRARFSGLVRVGDVTVPCAESTLVRPDPHRSGARGQSETTDDGVAHHHDTDHGRL